MRTSLLLLILLLILYPRASMQASTNLNEGVQFSYDPIEDVYRLSWDGNPDLFYGIGASEDLFSWDYFPTDPGIYGWEFATTEDRYFFRMEGDHGVRLAAECDESGGVRVEVDILRFAESADVEFWYSAGPFHIERATSRDGLYAQIAVIQQPVGTTSFSFIDRDVEEGETYYYRMHFQYKDYDFPQEDASPSNIASAYVTCPTPAPILQASCRSDRINLYSITPEWATSASNIHNKTWKIMRSTDPAGTFTEEYSGTSWGGIPYVDDDVTPGVTYYYYTSFTFWDAGIQQIVTSPDSPIVSASTCLLPETGPIDVAFILDNTGSMDSYISGLKTAISGILDDIALSSGDDYRLALVKTDTDIVNVRVPFAQNNRIDFADKLTSMSTNYGNNLASTDECLNTVVNGLAIGDRLPEKQVGSDFGPPFGEDDLGNPRAARKHVILLTDTVPGGFHGVFDQDALDRVQQLSTDARMDCIRITALQYGSATWAEDVMVTYAERTCGWYSQTVSSNPDIITDMVLSLISGDLQECAGSVEEGLPDCSP